MSIAQIEAAILNRDLTFEVRHEEEAENKESKSPSSARSMRANIFEFGLKEKFVGLPRARRRTGDTKISSTVANTSSGPTSVLL
jgi:hypothetical protein